ncbi:protein kinase [Bifidobacterium sp. 82T24]|nr:serine/threonine-protein kinase [Bifidobacterium pluvialisilvae]MBW3088651.1 protein kinase [Bifidobacterium pluvialisilvae]
MSDLTALNLEPGSLVGGYTLISRLGGGAMGSVWRVKDDGGNIYAMKILRDSLNDDGDDAANDGPAVGGKDNAATARERLRREAAALRRVNHPGVCQIADMELDDSVAFIVTELIEGKNLRVDVSENGRYEADDLVRLTRKLIDAVRAVHHAGIIHRDIKPTNVMISRTGPVLVDFGIAMGEGESHVTRTGLVMGTPGFIAPEIIDGAESDEQTDWWSTAAVLAFAATGRPVFGTSPMMAVLERAATGHANLAGLPQRTTAAFRSALDPKRENRCTPEELLQVIEQDALAPELWRGAVAGAGTAGTGLIGEAKPLARPLAGTGAAAPPSEPGGTTGDGVVRPFGRSSSQAVDRTDAGPGSNADPDHRPEDPENPRSMWRGLDERRAATTQLIDVSTPTSAAGNPLDKPVALAGQTRGVPVAPRMAGNVAGAETSAIAAPSNLAMPSLHAPTLAADAAEAAATQAITTASAGPTGTAMLPNIPYATHARHRAPQSSPRQAMPQRVPTEPAAEPASAAQDPDAQATQTLAPPPSPNDIEATQTLNPPVAAGPAPEPDQQATQTLAAPAIRPLGNAQQTRILSGVTDHATAEPAAGRVVESQPAPARPASFPQPEADATSILPPSGSIPRVSSSAPTTAPLPEPEDAASDDFPPEPAPPATPPAQPVNPDAYVPAMTSWYMQRGHTLLCLLAVPLCLFAASKPAGSLIISTVVLWLFTAAGLSRQSQLIREARRGGLRKGTDSALIIASLPWHLVKGLVLNLAPTALMIALFTALTAVLSLALGLPDATGDISLLGLTIPIPLLAGKPFSASGMMLAVCMAAGWFTAALGPYSRFARIGAGHLRGSYGAPFVIASPVNPVNPADADQYDDRYDETDPAQAAQRRQWTLTILWTILILAGIALLIAGDSVDWSPITLAN